MQDDGSFQEVLPLHKAFLNFYYPLKKSSTTHTTQTLEL